MEPDIYYSFQARLIRRKKDNGEFEFIDVSQKFIDPEPIKAREAAFNRRPLLSMILLMVLLYVVVMIGLMWRDELTPLVSAPTAALLAAFCWLFFAGVMYVLTRRRSLVR